MQDLFKVLQTDMLTTYWKIYIEKSQTIYPVCYPFFRRIIFLWAKHLIFCKFLYLIYNYFSLGGGRGVVDEYLLLLFSNKTVVIENMSLVLLFKKHTVSIISKQLNDFWSCFKHNSSAQFKHQSSSYSIHWTKHCLRFVFLNNFVDFRSIKFNREVSVFFFANV